jgi:hypothetical protein
MDGVDIVLNEKLRYGHGALMRCADEGTIACFREQSKLGLCLKARRHDHDRG